MHNIFLVYFVNPYMFQVYLGPSSGGTTICIQQLELILLDDCLSDPIQPGQHTVIKKRIISTSCCIHTVIPPDDGPRYARNM